MVAGTGTLTITRVAMSMRLMFSFFELKGIVQEARNLHMGSFTRLSLADDLHTKGSDV